MNSCCDYFLNDLESRKKNIETLKKTPVLICTGCNEHYYFLQGLLQNI